MSNEDLSAGFMNLQRLQARDEGFQTSVSQAVHWNADLLNKLVTRVNTLEASAALVTSEVKVALDGVSELNIARDKQLRVELASMAEMFKSGFERLEEAAASARPVGHTEDSDLSKVSTTFDGLQARMLDFSEQLQMQVNAATTRVEEIASTSNLVHSEAQLQLQVLNGNTMRLWACTTPAAQPQLQRLPPPQRLSIRWPEATRHGRLS